METTLKTMTATLITFIASHGIYATETKYGSIAMYVEAVDASGKSTMVEEIVEPTISAVKLALGY